MSDSSPPPIGLLAAGDPDPVIVHNAGGASPFVLIGDHAGLAIPQALGKLGLSDPELSRHIGWDIGVAALGEALASRLDAPFLRQAYSRLVIDCNRVPGAPGSIAEVSDETPIPGNTALTAADAEARRREIYQPYQDAIAALLDARATRGQPTLLVSLHSFTPVMQGFARPWLYGVLHRNDSPFSRAMLAVLREELGEAVVGDNQPYAMDGIDNTIPLHVDARPGLDYLELETRQDLIADSAGVAQVAPLVAQCLSRAAAVLPPP